MRLLTPAKAISAEDIAITTPAVFLLMHGTSTKPATGSQLSPSRFFSAIASAWPDCEGEPPQASTVAAADIAAADPTSA